MENCEFEEVVEHGLVIALRLADGKIIPMVSGGDDAVEDDKDKTKKPDAEGDAGKLDDEKTAREGAADGADDDDDAGTDEDEQDAAGSGDKSLAGLKKRLGKVIAQRNRYRTLGTPEELEALRTDVARYKKYEKEIADEDAVKLDEENRKKGIPTVAEQNAQLDRILDRRFGEGAAEDFEAFRETRQMELSRHIREGQTHLRSLLTEHGLNSATKGDAFDAWDRQIAAGIRKDPDRLARFKNPITQLEAIDEAFAEAKRFLIDPAVATASAGKIKALEKRRAAAPTSSGRNSAPEVKLTSRRPPDTMKDPRERQAAWNKIIEEASKEAEAIEDN